MSGPTKIYPKLGFLVGKYTIWQPLAAHKRQNIYLFTAITNLNTEKSADKLICTTHRNLRSRSLCMQDDQNGQKRWC
jgi:hypothetical protein